MFSKQLLILLRNKVIMVVVSFLQLSELCKFFKGVKPLLNARNIVGHNMLCTFDHHVEMCCNKLGVVGSSLKMVIPNFSCNICGWPGSCNNIAPGHMHQFSFQLATCCNTSQHGGQTHATSRCFTQQCCDMLRQDVVIVWLGLQFLIFRRGLKSYRGFNKI